MPFLSHRITESFGQEGTSDIIQFHTPCHGQGCHPQNRLLRPPYTLASQWRDMHAGRQGVKTNPDWSNRIWTRPSHLHLAVKGQWHSQQESRASEGDCSKHWRENTLYQHVASKGKWSCPSGSGSFNKNLFCKRSGTNGIETRSQQQREFEPDTQISAHDEQWGFKGPEPSTPKANRKVQIIRSPICYFGNRLFTEKKQVKIFHPFLFLDIKQE